MNKIKLAPEIALPIVGIATVAFILVFIDETFYLTIIGIAGFLGLGGVREWIDSQGSKTYILAGTGAVLVALFFGAEKFEFISAENVAFILQGLLGLGTVGAGATLAHGKHKEQIAKKSR